MSQLAKEKRDASRVMVSAFVDNSQRQALAELAASEDRSLSAVVRLALGEYLAKPKRVELLERADKAIARAGQFQPIKIDGKEAS